MKLENDLQELSNKIEKIGKLKGTKEAESLTTKKAENIPESQKHLLDKIIEIEKSLHDFKNISSKIGPIQVISLTHIQFLIKILVKNKKSGVRIWRNGKNK